MSFAASPYEKYQQQSILTASRGELTLMLYNGCIKFINRAIMMIENGDIQGSHEANIRAQLIMEEFMETLDMRYPIAERIMLVYDYLHSRLVEANIKKDKEILKEVLGFVIELRDTWEQVIKIAKEH